MGPVETFKGNAKEVERLINFDREVLSIVEGSIEDLHVRLRGRYENDRMNGGRVLTVVRGIRNNESLKSKYAAVYNQAVVLLVSHFASALGDLFRNAVSFQLENSDKGKLLAEEIRITYGELRDHDWNLKTVAPDLLISKHDYTFQDMQSTRRAFETYAKVELERDVAMNNIIAAQACRHAIVHAGGKVSDRTIRQLRSVNPRTIKPHIEHEDVLSFSTDEVLLVMEDMIEFVVTLDSKISETRSDAV